MLLIKNLMIDFLYIDIELKERHKSARNKLIGAKG
jgi:hypothetical protein